MKKSLLIFGILSSFFASAQCTISGKPTINVLEEATYTVTGETAQCKDCHLWSSIGDRTVISGDNKQNSVKIKSETEGRKTLTISMLTPQGLVLCAKNIDVLDAGKNTADFQSVPAQKSECDIDISNFKEAKSADQIVSFFPSTADNNFKYTWTADYFGGDKIISKDKTPQFPFTKESGISKVSLQVTSAKCIKNVSKTYEANFWKFF